MTGKIQHNAVDALGVGCERTREVEGDPRDFGVEEWSCHKPRWGQLMKSKCGDGGKILSAVGDMSSLRCLSDSKWSSQLGSWIIVAGVQER